MGFLPFLFTFASFGAILVCHNDGMDIVQLGVYSILFFGMNSSPKAWEGIHATYFRQVWRYE